MTARVTTLKGQGAGEYYVHALPSYYLDTGEPAGLWHGRGAEFLGLEGEVGDVHFLRLMAGLEPSAPRDVVLGRVYGEASVRGFDITASAPKSVSVLFAVGDDETRSQVLTAHDTAVATMIRWVEEHAHTRFRINGNVAIVDAEGIVAAAFRQHTSRALDPQLHTHVVIANRVRSPDGRWLALDARTLKLDQRTLSAVYHSTLRSELTDRLRVEWREPVNGNAEMAGVPDSVLDDFSTRTASIQQRVDDKLDRFIDSFGRSPTPRERWKLEREAVLDSRPSKQHPTERGSLHKGWRDRLRAAGHLPTDLLERVVDRVRPRDLQPEVMEATMTRAIAALSEKQSSWRPAEITREIAAALPTDIRLGDVDMVDLLNGLTDLAMKLHCVDISHPVPDGARCRRDGRPLSESVADRALTTSSILAQEERLIAWAERRNTRMGTDSEAAPKRSRVELTGPQAQTAAAVAGDADLVLVVGPAGTGKTTALAPGVQQLQTEGRAVFGVAPSAAAADVLATETGAAADTLDKLLIEHGLKRPPDHRYDLPPGATVIVDEAAMVPTDRLGALAQLADNRGWRVALVGDPMQFSAVGRGGMFNQLIDTHGAIELDEVHRFSNAWERDASLRLRRGDPAIADVYDLHGRLHGGTRTRMEAQAIDVWSNALRDGESVLLTAPTNEAVARLNAAAQQRRIDAGDLEARGRTIDVGDHQLRVGDQIVTRRNHRQLHTDRGLTVRNRDQWDITTIHRNGDLTVTGESGTVRLPADYVAEHVELGYAHTAHSTQGRTVDRSILVLDGATDVRGIYVPMTRGRHHNDAFITTTGEETAADVFAESLTQSWIDQPAVARQAELAGSNPHRPGTLPDHELRTLLNDQAQILDTLAHLDSELRWIPRNREEVQRELTNAVDHLSRQRERLAAAKDIVNTHDRRLRRRGHEVEISRARDSIEILPEMISAGEAHVSRLQTQLQNLDVRAERAEELVRTRPALESRLQDITTRLDDDQHIRSRHTRRRPPDRITSIVGERPRGGESARAWDAAVGKLDQHQTAFQLRSGIGPERHDAKSSGFQRSREIIATAMRQLSRGAHHHERGTELRSQGIGR